MINFLLHKTDDDYNLIFQQDRKNVAALDSFCIGCELMATNLVNLFLGPPCLTCNTRRTKKTPNRKYNTSTETIVVRYTKHNNTLYNSKGVGCIYIQ